MRALAGRISEISTKQDAEKYKALPTIPLATPPQSSPHLFPKSFFSLSSTFSSAFPSLSFLSSCEKKEFHISEKTNGCPISFIGPTGIRWSQIAMYLWIWCAPLSRSSSPPKRPRPSIGAFKTCLVITLSHLAKY